VLTVVSEDGITRDGSLLDEIVREGARRMLAAALEAEVNSYMAKLAHVPEETGRRMVVRNGYHQPRKGHHRGRCDRGEGPAGERQARR
jgi:hypothetical protein